jgi:Tol biopolymer transport system component
LSRGRTIALVAGVALAAAVLAFIAGRRAIAPSTVSSNVRVHRLTDWTGLEDAPAISPDGRWLAFVSNVSGSRQIWVRLMAGGAPLQLTRDAADHRFPRWSADSNGILFYSAPVGDATSGAVWEASALGGPPRRVAGSIGEADVSPDGRSIAFFRFEGGRVELTVATRDGSNARAIAQLDTGYSYLTPRWSPDARQVAYHRTVTSVGDLFIVEAGGGTPRQVTRDATVQQGFAWSPDGSRIIFSSARGATIRYLPSMNLWSIRPDGGDLRQLTFGEISYTSPDISRSGAIVASRLRVQSDVWRIPVDGDPRENAATAVRVTRQTSQVHTPSIAPDGREVAYVSDGGSHGNIWVHSLATGESRRITDEQDPELMVGLPLWSPTQAHIAYFTALRDSLNYWVLSPDGSNRRMLAPQAGWATWSPDGRWLYYSAQPSWKQLKKTPVDGGDAIVVRSDTATRPALSPDGGTLYYVIELPIWTGGSDYEIRTATPETSEGRVLARIPDHRAALFFHPVISPDGRWLAVALVDEPANNLWAISTATGELKQITDFGHRATSIVRRVSWTPDGKSIYAAIGDLDTDIVLLDGLQAR